MSVIHSLPFFTCCFVCYLGTHVLTTYALHFAGVIGSHALQLLPYWKDDLMRNPDPAHNLKNEAISIFEGFTGKHLSTDNVTAICNWEQSVNGRWPGLGYPSPAEKAAAAGVANRRANGAIAARREANQPELEPVHGAADALARMLRDQNTTADRANAARATTAARVRAATVVAAVNGTDTAGIRTRGTAAVVIAGTTATRTRAAAAVVIAGTTATRTRGTAVVVTAGTTATKTRGIAAAAAAAAAPAPPEPLLRAVQAPTLEAAAAANRVMHTFAQAAGRRSWRDSSAFCLKPSQSKEGIARAINMIKDGVMPSTIAYIKIMLMFITPGWLKMAECLVLIGPITKYLVQNYMPSAQRRALFKYIDALSGLWRRHLETSKASSNTAYM
jgi:hypothetical protein